MTAQDRKESAAIERRRAQEEERKKRIFNPKSRKFGIDYAALDAQITEKQKREKESRQREEQYLLLEQNYVATVKENLIKEKEEKRRLAEEINKFRLNYQKPEDRREFDLNDPKLYKRAIPARLYDDDPRCGPSSIQKFDGEDLNSKERRNIQREQLKAWLDQQMEEKEAAERERKESEDAYKAAVIARDQRAIELEHMEKECRKTLLESCNKFNKALAEERENYRIEHRKKEEADATAQKCNMLSSDLLLESKDVSISNLGPTRRIGYLYKGMSEEEIKAVREEQLQQAEENKKKKDAAKRFENDWQEYTNGLQKSIAIMDMEVAKKQKDMNKQIAEQNRLAGIEHKKQVEYLNKIVYTNKPTAAYYDQFNKTAR